MGIFNTFRSMLMLLATLFLSDTFLTVHAADSIKSSSFTGEMAIGTTAVGINIPNDNSSTENDLYFSFNAPAKDRSWVAFGMGGNEDYHMMDSLMFVVYRSDKPGGNVTVSPRLGKGHIMPQHAGNINVTVMAGSVANDTTFTANFLCSNCRNWGPQSIDLKNENFPFFIALGPDTKLASSDVSKSIVAHDPNDTGLFFLNLVRAVGAGGVPIIGGPGDTQNDADGYDDEDGATYVSATVLVHMLAMCGAFVIVFPIGYLLLRVLNKVVIHWVVQTLGLMGVIIGAALGLKASIGEGYTPKLTHPHQILGLIVTGMVFLTYGFGLFGHLSFKRTAKKSPVMLSHRFLGPGSILLGLVNACVGFSFAGRPRAIIGFIIIATAMAIFVSAIVMLKKKARRKWDAMNSQSAANFREGYNGNAPPPQYNQYGGHPPDYYAPHGTAVPLQTFAPPPGQPAHGHVEQVSVQPK